MTNVIFKINENDNFTLLKMLQYFFSSARFTHFAIILKLKLKIGLVIILITAFAIPNRLSAILYFN